MPKKVAVITGGAGFIGSHLCDRLIGEGLKVYCLDNFITGAPENIRHLLKNVDFRLIECNVTKQINIKGRVDFCLHFASLASPEDYLRYPIQTLKVGSLGTHNALGLAKEKKASFMLASTSEVYGDPLVHPQPESYWGNVNPVGVRGCYDESKRFAEALTMAYHRIHGINTKIVRIFNTYGERMRINDGRVVPNFIHQALHNKPLTVYGKGKQTRSFCYIDDLIEGIFRLMLSKTNDPVNLGNPNEFTILQLMQLVIKLTGAKSRVVFKELPQDDPRQRQPDISIARKVLHWKPEIKLKEGLERTIEWFRNKS
ncbi:MAG TPA: UDP-glucuronic acid decarboxylase family protein [Candidatus Margulisiibacteriota bacterium]|nr:UDP-glucuronic acid decarboxylase family protein [Candidatus Margulisiibacteriota bacterium]